jgi:Mn-dependent DtxR family transcriptional regulator
MRDVSVELLDLLHDLADHDQAVWNVRQRDLAEILDCYQPEVSRAVRRLGASGHLRSVRFGPSVPDIYVLTCCRQPVAP